MAAADTARLVAQLTLDAKGFNAGVKSADRSIGKLEGTVGRIGQKAGQGLATFGKNVALIGVAAAGGIALAVKGGLSDLAELETAVTSVDGAIAQLGLTGQLTGKQVADWANDIERDIGAAFDDKEITAAAATLLRYGKVAPKNLKPALVVMTDLAAKTGDIDSASSLLAKALADPAKAAGKLAKAGVVLTKAQQDTIKAMVEQNDIAGAQEFILGELAKTTGGAAAASQGKYQRALSVLNDVAEDARKALAEGFLPVIEKVADRLSTALADPKFVQGLRDFGTELAGGLDDLIDIAAKLPWETIGQSLKIAGAGAKAVLEAFTSLPPWVQTAVITGWGLNKLTGGALGGIVKELGSGLIKGVLGMNAGVVNINAGVVNGVGGLPAAAGGAATTAAGLTAGAVATTAVVGGTFAVGITASLLEIEKAAEKNNQLAERGLTEAEIRAVKFFQGDQAYQQAALKHLGAQPSRADFESGMAKLQSGIGGLSVDERQTKRAADQVRDAVHNSASQAAAIGATNQAAAFAIRDKVATSGSAITGAVNAAKAVAAQTTAAARAAGQQTAAAIRDKDLSVTVNPQIKVTTNISVRQLSDGQTLYKQYNRWIG